MIIVMWFLIYIRISFILIRIYMISIKKLRINTFNYNYSYSLSLLLKLLFFNLKKNPALPLIIISYRVLIHKWQYNSIYLNMPQLIPFFFLNQVVFNFSLLILIVYMFSKYLLPRFVRVFKTRIHISRL